MSYGYIYLIKDHYTNKVYIGRRKGNEFESLNYFGSGLIISRIIKNRKHHLSKIILGYCETKEELVKIETECIKFFDATNKLYGYNLKSLGNDGGWETVNSRPKSTKYLKQLSKRTKGINNPMFGVSPLQRLRNKYGDELGYQKYLEMKENSKKAKLKLYENKNERIKLSKGQKKRFENPEEKQKLKQRNKEISNRKEVRESRRKRMIGNTIAKINYENN